MREPKTIGGAGLEKQSNRGPENNLGLAELVAAVAHHRYGVPAGMAVGIGRDVEQFLGDGIESYIAGLKTYDRDAPVRKRPNGTSAKL